MSEIDKIPKFSVLMSVYYKDNADWLKKSIESVLTNSVLPDEFIIVKDGSLTNELETVLSLFSNNKIIKIVGYPENKGLGDALNYGLSFCKNDLVARMDSDDISAPNRFDEEINMFLSDPELDIVGSNVDEFIGDEDNIVATRIVPETNEEIREYIKKRSPFNHPVVMFKRKSVIEAGGYQDLFRLEDYYLWYRMIKNNLVGYNIQKSLLKMRTASDFYKRRGGLKAFKSRITISKIMLKDKYINIFTYMYIYLINFVNAIIPDFLRALIFKKFLRKSYK